MRVAFKRTVHVREFENTASASVGGVRARFPASRFAAEMARVAQTFSLFAPQVAQTILNYPQLSRISSYPTEPPLVSETNNSSPRAGAISLRVNIWTAGFVCERFA